MRTQQILPFDSDFAALKATATQITRFHYNKNGVCLNPDTPYSFNNKNSSKIKYTIKVALTHSGWHFGYMYQDRFGGGRSPVSLNEKGNGYKSRTCAGKAATHYLIEKYIKSKWPGYEKKPEFKVMMEWMQYSDPDQAPQLYGNTGTATQDKNDYTDQPQKQDRYMYEMIKKKMNGRELRVCAMVKSYFYEVEIADAAFGSSTKSLDQVKSTLENQIKSIRRKNSSVAEYTYRLRVSDDGNMLFIDKVNYNDDIQFTMFRIWIEKGGQSIQDENDYDTRFSIQDPIDEADYTSGEKLPANTVKTIYTGHGKKQFKHYVGSKAVHGLLQFIINHIPYHESYLELFAGSAAVYFGKKPAKNSYLMEKSPDQYRVLVSKTGENIVDNGCAIDYLAGRLQAQKLNADRGFTRNDFIYLDPPYPLSARSSGKHYYNCEMTDDDHIKLLSTIVDLNANIMISTRQNDLYDIKLKDWHKKEFLTAGRAGAVKEIIYMNYDISKLQLHQYDYVGDGCTDRQRVKRKVNRFAEKLDKLDAKERDLFIQTILAKYPSEVQKFLSIKE